MEKQVTEENKEKKQAVKEDKKPKKDKIIKVKESEHLAAVEGLAEYKDKYLRLYAEFDNARKRMERDKQEFVKYANEQLISDFLMIFDHLDGALKAAKQSENVNSDELIKGLDMVQKSIDDALAQNNVKPIEAEGKLFDHNCHEILMQEETDEHADGAVLEVFQRGYNIGDRVLRTAKVKIAKNTTNEETKQETEAS